MSSLTTSDMMAAACEAEGARGWMAPVVGTGVCCGGGGINNITCRLDDDL
jgi:hypothetical protein